MRQSSSSSYIAHLSGVLLLSLALVLLTNMYPSYGVHQFLPGSPRLFGSVPDSLPISFARAEASPSFSSNSLTDVVQWDSFSLIVKGQRIFLQYVYYVVYVDLPKLISVTAPENSTLSASLFLLCGSTFFKRSRPQA